MDFISCEISFISCETGFISCETGFNTQFFIFKTYFLVFISREIFLTALMFSGAFAIFFPAAVF
jgi:hypothetical protein